MKKLFILFLILISTFSVASAYTTDDILANLTTLYDNGAISGLPTNYDRNPAWNYLRSFYNNYGITNYHIGITSSTSPYLSNKLVIGAFSSGSTSVINYTNDTSNTFYYAWKSNSNYYSWFVFNLNASNYSNGSFDWNKATWSYFYTTIDINTRGWQQEANSEYGGSYILSSFEFNPTDTSGYIDITANGVTESFIRRPFSYSVNNTRLGYITNPNDFYYIEGYISYFVDVSGGSNVLERFAGFTKNQVGLYTNKLFLNVNGEVSVKTSTLLNFQGIALYFVYKETPESDYETSDVYYYYTYYYGSNPSSGDLISPDLNSTVDVGLVNALDEFFDVESGESNVPYLIDSVFASGDVNFSGDLLPSGDLFGIPYVSYDNWGFGDFVVWCFNGLVNAFTSYEDITLNSGFLGNISSADFKLPENAVSSFIGFLCNSALLIRFLFWYWNLTITISTLDYEHLSGYEIDNNFFLF